MSDSEYEDEEFLVYADFGDQLLPTVFNSTEPKTRIKIIGLEGQTPIAEIDGNIFKGKYDFAMGTQVFFERDVETSAEESPFEESCKEKYKYVAKTNKVINFQRIYVEKNEAYHESQNAPTAASQYLGAERLKIDVTYDDAIQQFPPLADCNTAQIDNKKP